jgi:hypothetical protein
LVYDLPRWPELDEYYQIKAEDVEANQFQKYFGLSKKSTSALRKQYRIENPPADAKLFVRGDVTTLQTRAAKDIVMQIMEENRVDERDVPGWEKTMKGRTPSKGLPRNGGVPTGDEPRDVNRFAAAATADPPSFLSWDELSGRMDRETVTGLADLWFPVSGSRSQPLSTEVERKVRPLCEFLQPESDDLDSCLEELRRRFERAR